ncbi:MAG: biotin/lipoyl-binding protein [Clostridiales bacterium]|jgi:biotin carboxyl carrier protein|nr:biotin/lipoyl-binding protein [Clostridiales bacterium]
MKKYNVIVNGTKYEVEIELAGEYTPSAAPAAPAAAPAAPVEAAPAAPVAAAPAAVPEGGEKITSPMPGTILSINVTNGSAVKRGDVLVILEAMKMENEILSPCDGTATAVSVARGQSVESGTLICVIA